MFGWLKRFFSSVPDAEISILDDPAPVKDPVVEEPKATKPKKATTTKKKAAPKKAAKVDLDSMKKDELLAHAKANGIKANASMNKAALIEAIKNG